MGDKTYNFYKKFKSILYALLILLATILGCSVIVVHYYLNNRKQSSWDCDKSTNTCKDPGTGLY
jgi:hypothetical protein